MGRVCLFWPVGAKFPLVAAILETGNHKFRKILFWRALGGVPQAKFRRYKSVLGGVGAQKGTKGGVSDYKITNFSIWVSVWGRFDAKNG